MEAVIDKTQISDETYKKMKFLANKVAQAKRKMDEAKETYDALREELEPHMIENNIKSMHAYNGDELVLMQKTTNKVNPIEYKNHVTEEEFFASIDVKVTEAKKFLPQRLYETCITSSKGEPYIQVTPVEKIKKGK